MNHPRTGTFPKRGEFGPALLLLLLSVIAWASPLHAGAPSVPAYSTVDSVLAACPAGDFVFHVSARVAPGILAFRVFHILVDITDCPALALRAIDPATGLDIVVYSTGRRYLRQACSPNGHAEFHVPGGGVASGVPLAVIDDHDGIVLATRTTLLSPDQNGDLLVDDADVAIASLKLGTTDPTADFDLDGLVTEGDVAILRQHLGHTDPASLTPTAASSWGRIKALYRGAP